MNNENGIYSQDNLKQAKEKLRDMKKNGDSDDAIEKIQKRIKWIEDILKVEQILNSPK